MPICKKCDKIYPKNGIRTTLCNDCWYEIQKKTKGNRKSPTKIHLTNKEKKKIRNKLAGIRPEDL